MLIQSVWNQALRVLLYSRGANCINSDSQLSLLLAVYLVLLTGWRTLLKQSPKSRGTAARIQFPFHSATALHWISGSGSNTKEHKETPEIFWAKSLHLINLLLFSYYLSLESSFFTHDFMMDCQPSHLTDVLNFSFLFRFFLNSYILDLWDHLKWSTTVRFQMPYLHLYLSLHQHQVELL